MEFLSSSAIVYFALQAAFLAGLMYLFARKEADIEFVKLIFAVMGITVGVVLVHMAFTGFAGTWVLAIDFLIILSIIRKFFDIRLLRTILITACYMAGTGAIHYAVSTYLGKQDTLSERFAADQEDTVESGMREIRALQKGTAGEGETSDEMKAALGKGHEVEINIPKARSLGQEMMLFKNKAMTFLPVKESNAPATTRKKKTKPSDSKVVKTADPAPEHVDAPDRSRKKPEPEEPKRIRSDEEELMAIVLEGPSAVDRPPGKIEVKVKAKPTPAPVAPTVALTYEAITPEEFESMFVVELPPEKQARITVTHRDGSVSTPDLNSSSKTINVKIAKNPNTGGPDLARSAIGSLVGFRNQSTDPNYQIPNIKIQATGKGSRGAHVLANGKFIGVGTVLWVDDAVPQSWKLHSVENNLIIWEPVP